MNTIQTTVDSIFAEHIRLAEATRGQLTGAIAELADDIATAVESGGKLLTFGNGAAPPTRSTSQPSWWVDSSARDEACRPWR